MQLPKVSPNAAQETLFVFVTHEGRIMACLTDGTITDVTDFCDLLPRQVCKESRHAEVNPRLSLAA